MVLPEAAWLRSAFGALIGQIGPETDQLILRARASGERWVAGVRLFVVAGLSVLVVAMAPTQRWTGLTLLLLVGLLHALLLAWLAFHVAEPWVPWLSCAADVALTSAALLFVLRHGGAGAALPTRSLYELYFLVIMSAGLRYDWRLCLWTAGLCILAHALLLWVAAGPLGVEGADGGVGRATQAVHFAMRALGGIIMAAVAQRAKRLRLMVGVDHLTGLSQRAPFVERIDEELARARRRGSPLSVAILDLDGFKAFNDTFGHPVGDRALQAVATRLRSSVRKSDLVARFGGEEFVVAFPETAVEQARQRVEHIRAELARVSIQVGRGEQRQVTVSAGLGSWPADGETFDAVLTTADARLYQAKRSGKNRVVAPDNPFIDPLG
ncbi:MAG TPA: GGDEF domain-containing protein [Myxococcaceae bacterium]|nr:GGDEF domain-containing protein [Myxococcaceae bacterium]